MISINIKSDQSSIKNRYRPEIDGLRAFAVVAVIINHLNKEVLPNGYLGVDIFFVISGFVITSSLYERPSKNFYDFIGGFYERRIKRVLPALSVFVLITSIIICLFNPYPDWSLKTGLSSIFGLSNLYLSKNSSDYFAHSTQLNVFTHTWSLCVEEQFYVIFPFIIWFSGFGRQTKNCAVNLFLIIGTLAIVSLIGFLYLYPINQSAAYFLMPTRFWEIASGCLLFIGFQRRKSLEKFLERLSSIFVLALIVGIMYLPISWEAVSTVAVVTLSVILIASLKKQTTGYKIFTHPKVVYIGLLSYSLYLWHWGVLTISRWTIGIHWWSVPFQVALIFCLAITSYRYIETPLRKGKLFGKGWKKIFVGGGMIFTLSGVLIALERPLRNPLYVGKRTQTETKKFSQGEECLANVSELTQCFVIDNKSKRTLWILGDSHAISLLLAGEQVANASGLNFKLYSNSATTFPPVKKYIKTQKELYLKKVNEMKFVEEELYREIKEGDIIFLSMRMPLHFGGQYFDYLHHRWRYINKYGFFVSQDKHFDEWISSVKNLANIAQKKDAKIIIQTATPEWEDEFLNSTCSTSNIQWFNSLNKKNCQIKSKFFIGEETGLYKHLSKKLNQLSTSHENIYLFDTYKFVCPESMCSFTKDGIDIYRDDDHISLEWARDNLYPEILKFIRELRAKKNI